MIYENKKSASLMESFILEGDLFDDALSFFTESEYNYNSMMEQVGIFELKYMEENGQEIVYTEAEAEEVKGEEKKWYQKIIDALIRAKDAVVKFFEGIMDKIKSFHPVLDKLSKCQFKKVVLKQNSYEFENPYFDKLIDIYKNKFDAVLSEIDSFNTYEDIVDKYRKIIVSPYLVYTYTISECTLSKTVVGNAIKLLKTTDIHKIKQNTNKVIKDMQDFINDILKKLKDEKFDDNKLAMLKKFAKNLINLAYKTAADEINYYKIEVQNAKYVVSVALKNIDKNPEYDNDIVNAIYNEF